MALLLGLLIFSFVVNSILIVPFINLLYRLNFKRRKQETKDFQGTRTKIFDQFHQHKAGTPVGGGVLIIASTAILFTILFPIVKYLGVYVTAVYPIKEEFNVIFFTFISFGLLGIYDDIKKFFGYKQEGIFGLRLRHKLVIQIILGLIISLLLFMNLKIDFVHIPFFGVFQLGWWYVPFSTLVIVGFANAFNITDGLDGLSSGLLMICLIAFWIISATILDTTLSIFLTLWIGAIIAFLYFNVYPARIWLGDVGALSFGATLAVVGLLLGKTMALLVIGGLFIIEAGSSFTQILYKKLFHKKLFKCAPLHLWLQYKGWEEPKIVQRAWLAGIMLAIFGLWLAVI